MNEQATPERAAVVDAVLRARRSLRAYRADAVPHALVRDILAVASSAPSNSNTQPWRVHAIAGPALQTVGDALVAAFRENRLPPSPHFPEVLPEEHAQRQRDFGATYYGALGIASADMPGRMRQTEKNFHFFGAPVGLVFTIDRRLAPHSWLDLGLLVQNVMIAAAARGLGTCPQVSFARFHPVLAQHLAMGEHELTACGMALGYALPDAPVNRMDVPRRPVDAFTCFDLFGADVPAAAGSGQDAAARARPSAAPGAG